MPPLTPDLSPRTPDYNPTVAVVHQLPYAADYAAHARPSGAAAFQGWNFLGIIRRNLMLIGISAVLLAGGTALFTAQVPKVYSAAATLRIDQKQRRSPALDLLYLASENQVRTEMEMLRSRSLAEAVVDSLGLRFRLLDPARVPESHVFANISLGANVAADAFELVRRSGGAFDIRHLPDNRVVGSASIGRRAAIGDVSFELLPAAAQQASLKVQILRLEDAADSLTAALQITRRGRDADIIQVEFEGTDPIRVRDVPNVLVSRFIAARNDVWKTESRSTSRFLRTQLERLSVQLREAEDSLRTFRQAQGVVSPSDQANVAVHRAADLRAQRGGLEVERSALASLLDQAHQSAADDPARGAAVYRSLIGFPSLLSSQLAAGLLSSLNAAEDQRLELLRRRRPEDVEVRLLTGRIAELEQRLHSTATTYLQGLTEQQKAVDAELSQSARQLDSIPAWQLHYARLDRQVRVLDAIYTSFQSHLKEAELAEAVEDPTVRVVDVATMPQEPIRPKPLINLALALFAGLSLGGSAAVAREYADESVHTRFDVLGATGVPVLALIPRAHDRSRWRMARLTNAFGRLSNGNRIQPRVSTRKTPAGRVVPLADLEGRAVADAFQRFAVNLAYVKPDAPRVIAVTSALAGDGKTTCSINIATTLARRGRRVLLIDADLRRGKIADVLGLPLGAGLGEALLDPPRRHELTHAVQVGEAAVLYVLGTGTLPKNPVQLLASTRMASLMAEIRDEFDVIVIDTPPINVVADASLLATYSDAVLLVARSGKTPVGALTFAMEQLHAVHANVAGALLNDIDFDRDSRYDAAYRYSRYDTYDTKPA